MDSIFQIKWKQIRNKKLYFLTKYLLSISHVEGTKNPIMNKEGPSLQGFCKVNQLPWFDTHAKLQAKIYKDSFF